MIGRRHAAIRRQFDRHCNACRFSDQCGNGLGQLGLLAQRRQHVAKALQVLDCDDATARPRKQHPGAGYFDVFGVILLPGRCAGLCRFEPAPRDAQQRFVAGWLERRQRFARRGQKLFRFLFRVRQGRGIALQENFQFESRIDIAGAYLRRLGSGIEAQFHRPRYQWIGYVRSGLGGFAQTHSPDEFQLAFHQRAGKLLLQGKQADVEMGHLPASAFGFGPGLPYGFKVTGVLHLDFGAKGIVGKCYPRPRIDRGISGLRDIDGRHIGIAMRAGGNERRALNFGCETGRGVHCRSDVEPRREPGTFSLGWNLWRGLMRHRQPDFLVPVRATVVQPQAFDAVRLLVEKKEAAMVGNVRYRPAARAHRLLCVVDERNKAPLLEVHGR